MKLRLISSLAVLVGLGVGTETAFSQTNSLFPNNSTAAQTGRGGTGNQTVAGAPGTTQLGQLSNNAAQGGFVGRNDNTGRFVGNTIAGQQNANSNRNFGGSRGGTARGGQNNFNRNNGFGSRGATQRPLIRPVHRIAFRYTASTRTTISTKLQSQYLRITRSNNPQGMTGVNVKLNNRNLVTITGVVGSESDKKLAAALARLEPGVRSVSNKLVVRQ